MSFINSIIIILFGSFKGKDIYGNKYYTLKILKKQKEKRVVIFKGKAEPTKVPDIYECWLRNIIIDFPNKNNLGNSSPRYLKIPNVSGTKYSFNPRLFNAEINSYNKYQSWKE